MRRRTFTLMALSALAAPFVLAAEAMAKPFAAYQAGNFPKLLASGAPLIVHVHADWCPTCRRQITILDNEFKTGKFNKVNAVRVNFDKDKQFLTDYRVTRQATIIVFRGGKEVTRLVYDTNEDRIRKTIEAAL